MGVLWNTVYLSIYFFLVRLFRLLLSHRVDNIYIKLPKPRLSRHTIPIMLIYLLCIKTSRQSLSRQKSSTTLLTLGSRWWIVLYILVQIVSDDLGLMRYRGRPAGDSSPKWSHSGVADLAVRQTADRPRLLYHGGHGTTWQCTGWAKKMTQL